MPWPAIGAITTIAGIGLQLLSNSQASAEQDRRMAVARENARKMRLYAEEVKKYNEYNLAKMEQSHRIFSGRQTAMISERGFASESEHMRRFTAHQMAFDRFLTAESARMQYQRILDAADITEKTGELQQVDYTLSNISTIVTGIGSLAEKADRYGMFANKGAAK